MKIQPMFQHCPICKGMLQKVKHNQVLCKSCTFQYYFNPCPVNAIIILNDRGEVLLVERKFDPGKGLWDLPGGFIDIGESIEESVVREAKEELGVTVSNIRYISSYADLYPFKGVVYRTLGIVCAATAGPEKIRAHDDAAAVRFFAKTNIPFDKIAFQSVKQGLREYFSV